VSEKVAGKPFLAPGVASAPTARGEPTTVGPWTAAHGPTVLVVIRRPGSAVQPPEFSHRPQARSTWERTPAPFPLLPGAASCTARRSSSFDTCDSGSGSEPARAA